MPWFPVVLMACWVVFLWLVLNLKGVSISTWKKASGYSRSLLTSFYTLLAYIGGCKSPINPRVIKFLSIWIDLILSLWSETHSSVKKFKHFQSWECRIKSFFKNFIAPSTPAGAGWSAQRCWIFFAVWSQTSVRLSVFLRFLNHNTNWYAGARKLKRFAASVVCEKYIHGLAIQLASAIATSPLRCSFANALPHPHAQPVNLYVLIFDIFSRFPTRWVRIFPSIDFFLEWSRSSSVNPSGDLAQCLGMVTRDVLLCAPSRFRSNPKWYGPVAYPGRGAAVARYPSKKEKSRSSARRAEKRSLRIRR